MRYPGIPTTADGSAAVVWVETHVTQAAAAYPITPSTNMGAGYAQAVANGQRNLWGEPLHFLELESEHSSASTCEGFALAGGRVTNFTSGQGLILMKEVLYTISGKRLPVVFHIGGRALTSHALNVHAGHDDVMGVADCGWGILFARNAQEAADLALIARRAAEDSFTPFMNVQDGFLTTHTVENVRLPEPELMREFLANPNEKLISLFDPAHPLMTGVVQDQDAYMKGKIAQRHYYDQVEPALCNAMREFSELTGRHYDLVDAYRLDDAEYAFVGMGSMMETARATADWLRANTGLRVGVLHITAYRPFPGPQVVRALRNVRAITVLERMDDPLARSNALLRDIKAAFADALIPLQPFIRVDATTDRLPLMVQCAAGLGGRDVRPAHFLALADNMRAWAQGRPHREFCSVGIRHETALDAPHDPDVRPPGAFSMRGYSIGGYGAMATNRIIADLLAELFDLYVQAYPKFGSSKKGLPTNYFLTAAPEPIRTHCELHHVEFIPLHDIRVLTQGGDPLEGLTQGGTVFINTRHTDPAEIWTLIPRWARQRLRDRNAHLLALDTFRIADEVARRPDLRIRMMGVVLVGVFLRVCPLTRTRPFDELMTAVEQAVRRRFEKRGEDVVQDNLTCIRRGYQEVIEIPRDIMNTEPDTRGSGVGLPVEPAGGSPAPDPAASRRT